MHTETMDTHRVAAWPWWLSRGGLASWWVLAGIALLFALGAPPVQRTQEARVLECAREMLGDGARAWMVPMLDGHLRVRKPPLCYWMAAAAYEVGGIGEGVGRVPTVLLGWLTLALTFACGNWLFGRRAGFFAAACLLCSYLFFRYTRLAETDAPAMFFVTAGIYAFWRAVGGQGSGFGVQSSGSGVRGSGVRGPGSGSGSGVRGSGVRGQGSGDEEFEIFPKPEARSPSSEPSSEPRTLNPETSCEPRTPNPETSFEPRSLNPSLWFHLGAAATALAILSKGPPGFYPPLFLLVLVIMRRRWDALRRFVLCGAPLTLLLIAAPWFIYVFHAVGIEQWRKESDELLGGEDHGAPFYVYFVELLKATAPWSLVMPGALIAAVQRLRDSRIAGLIAWIAVIFVPLCLVANKQFHYLMPLMPPLMVLTGWWLDLVLGHQTAPMHRRIPLLDFTLLITALAIAAVPLAARAGGSGISPLDWVLTAGIAAGVLIVLIVYFRGGYQPALLVYLAAVLAVMVPAVSFLAPRYEDANSRQVASAIRNHFGDGPYCFYGKNLSLQLCFNWRRQIPQEVTPEDLESLARTEPDVVVIAQTKPAHAPPKLPPGFTEQWRLPLAKQTIVFYQHKPADAARRP